MRTLLTFTLVLLLLSCNNNKEKKLVKETATLDLKENNQVLEKNNFGLAEITMDPALKTRMNDYFRLTMDLNLEKLMNYVYPKIFEQASREQMISEIKGSFENEEMKAQIDSIHVDKVSPAFQVEDGEYVKVYYSMRMNFDFKGDLEQDPGTSKPNALAEMILPNCRPCSASGTAFPTITSSTLEASSCGTVFIKPRITSTAKSSGR